MEFFTNKRNLKIISLLLVILIIFSVVNPFAIYAKDEDEDEVFGGLLFQPISKLVCGMGDGVIIALQKMFVGYWGIKDKQYETESTVNTVYQILYSPGIIFSNKVPALNADFINPTKGTYQVSIEKHEELAEIKSHQFGYSVEGEDAKRSESYEKEVGIKGCKANEYGYNTSSVTKISNVEEKNELLLNMGGYLTDSELYKWKYDKDGDKSEETYYLLISCSQDSPNHWVIRYAVYTDKGTTLSKGEEIKYSAGILQPIISKWYKALRLIALVGLLSVLVYVGIRIIISSTGQEKSKYKKMIVDWLAAVCILFILQYIMSFTTTIVSELIDIFPNVVNEIGEDTLMSGLRTSIAKADGTFWNVFGETIMYTALVILTCVFTMHYLKRLIYLAFLTMIAPLISLTYPLDKIKDRTSTGIWNVDKRICI